MSDFDSKLPIRGLAVDLTTEVADSAGLTINPAKEDGNLASIKTKTDNLDVTLSTRASEATLSAAKTDLDGIKTDTDTLAGTVATGRVNVNIQVDAPVNVAQISGTAASVNTGNADAGTLRVVLATNQPTIAVTTTPPTETAPDYKTASAVAAAASDTHSLTPAGTILLDKITASASGQLKVEVQWGATGSETSKWVGFTSAANKYIEFALPNPVSIPNTSTIKVIVTNTDNQAQDVYSSIVYH